MKRARAVHVAPAAAWAASAVAAALLWSAGAVAATLQISPVTIEFSAAEVATGLTLRNPGDAPLYGQVRVFEWSEAHGDDVLTPTGDVIASPPLIEIAPHSDQLVRLVRAKAPGAPGTPPQGASGGGGAEALEQSYRILIDELPAPGTPGAEGVTIRLRYSVPVFVDAAGAGIARPLLAWRLVHEPQGYALRADNSGTRRAQIAAVSLFDDAGHHWDVTNGLLGYALARQSRQWSVPIPADAKFSGQLKVRATVNTLPLEDTVSIEQGG
ncbi:fimbrial chaperone protein [Paraburkholderia bannensis]|uniref:Fimbrial chaperone protein n=1 Tax=Paraburkholderia bannensis TaxID=765414 RepID=A0A7W9WQP3_9BURK|nr:MULTISPECIES: fimbria/pilus periplasmic chaperone [Paraburkholderia]MBB3257304.1 fimbrial chaperone protein [Paraburkholderia sp. WP4_3_2]MBB6102300.1 fimbrial chaperone protein [Paraburkholderia bannensis]